MPRDGDREASAFIKGKAKLKKMLSWSSDSEDEDEELKAIEKDVIIHRRNLKVVDEPQLLKRRVDSNTINLIFLRDFFVNRAMSSKPHLLKDNPF